MKVIVNSEVCVASGLCTLRCPSLFGRDEEGRATLLQETIPSELEEDVRMASEACPAAAIEIIE
jgi:ferredoxin